jgi:hypothetical protein
MMKNSIWYPPAIVLLACAAAWPQSGHGNSGLSDLVIGTQPDSAVVLLDDSIRGLSPCTVNGVTPGNHTLLLRKKGFYVKKVELVVDSASPRSFSFSLLKPASLLILSDPPGALLRIDGKNEGLTPFSDDKVKPGDHAVSAKLKGYLLIEKTISEQSAGRDTVRLVFERPAGYQDSVAKAAVVARKAAKEHEAIVLVSALFCLAAVVLVMIEQAQ